jgi:hypothetical protein
MRQSPQLSAQKFIRQRFPMRSCARCERCFTRRFGLTRPKGEALKDPQPAGWGIAWSRRAFTVGRIESTPTFRLGDSSAFLLSLAVSRAPNTQPDAGRGLVSPIPPTALVALSARLGDVPFVFQQPIADATDIRERSKLPCSNLIRSNSTSCAFFQASAASSAEPSPSRKDKDASHAAE